MPARPSAHALSPQQRTAFRDRLRRVVQLIGTQAEAARIAEVSLSQMKKYLAGQSLPIPYRAGDALAHAAEKRVEWLMNGTSPEEPGPVKATIDLIEGVPMAADADPIEYERMRRLTRAAFSVLEFKYKELGVDPAAIDLSDAAQAMALFVSVGSDLAGKKINLTEAESRVKFLTDLVHKQAHRFYETKKTA